MDKFEYINELLPFYLQLLTQRQQEICKAYYYDDLSLSEIAENLNISRNAIFDCLKKSEQILINYEEKLHLCANYNKRQEIFAKLRMLDNEIVEQLVQQLDKLED